MADKPCKIASYILIKERMDKIEIPRSETKKHVGMIEIMKISSRRSHSHECIDQGLKHQKQKEKAEKLTHVGCHNS